ncbi:Wzz/FepE/Etk N-terminal domain-containing protein [Limobrevibacterium gyesilva]|uniref:non-specific protein-tyrosine kinase n=1 Tax=Limobrevibacterium gyesilva TaxID=2991712 RepID=A0AA42CI31_9PROT|nr:Wzz/FepE/Etk N-terminal domain-containing protein [Limobrevibacterium gyesilva]MCW3475475.1 Wzz/FepE/Etk N-terminal domain-containing protein [Limobrevibacterium gyesilva]
MSRPGDTLQVDIVGAAPHAGAPPPEAVSPLRLFAVLRRRRMTVLVVAACVLAVAVPRILALASRYEATALVLVDTRKNKLSDLQAIVGGAQSEAIEVRTQVDILRSPALAEQVVTRLNLVREPEFAAVLNEPPAMWRVLLGEVLARLEAAPPPAPPRSEDEKIRIVTTALVTDKVSVMNDGRSYVIGVVARTANAALSARIANAYARVYLDFNRELKDRAVMRANAWLDGRLAPLQQKLRNAERAVAAFRAENGLVEDHGTGPGGERRGTVAGQQMTQVNTQLVAATNDRLQKDAEIDEIRRAMDGRGDPFAVPQVVASPLIQRLRGQEAELSAREASASLQQRDESPQLMSLRAEKRDIRARIQSEALKIIGSIESEANAARGREAALRASLQELQGQVAAQGTAAIRLRELESEAEAARIVYTDYLNRAERTSNERDIQQPDAELISVANVPTTPAAPTKRQYLFLALLAAGLLGVVAALVRDRTEPGVRTAEQLEAETGLVTLGFVPRTRRRKRALNLDARAPAYVDAIGSVRSVLQCAEVAGRPRVILVTSALPREGKTFLAISLARSVALAGGRSLLIDCDLRRPSVAAVLGIDAEPGLGAGSLGAAPGVGIVATNGLVDRLVKRDAASELDIITAGDAPMDAPVLVASAQLRALVNEARDRYDLVVIDAPPVLGFVDARVLSQVADATVMVVRWRKTPRAMVQSALKALRTYGARISGTVLTQVDLNALGAYEGSHAYVLRKYGSYFR